MSLSDTSPELVKQLNAKDCGSQKIRLIKKYILDKFNNMRQKAPDIKSGIIKKEPKTPKRFTEGFPK
jgi:hypothetical protein